MKKCFKCGIEKDLSNFYKHKQMSDGHLNKCIVCTKNDIKIRYDILSKDESFVYNERKRGRSKYHRLYSGKKKANKDSILKFNLLYPEKKFAKNKCSHIIVPEFGLEKHHWSYNEDHYKDLIFITKKQHMKAHRFIVYDQERMMYRRYDTNELLDTKEKHESFILFCIENKED